MTTSTPVNHCPYCERRLSAATVVDALGREVVPRERDVSLCIGCGGILIFRADLTVRTPLWSERRLLERLAPKLTAIREAIKAAELEL